MKDRVHLAQVDETRARIMLAEGRIIDAEKLVSAAVRTLESGDEKSLLAEALSTHGVALARLHHPEKAHSTLERAIDVAHHAGDLQSAGLAALIIIEQLNEHLSNDELCATVERAEMLLEETSDMSTLKRLCTGASRVLSRVNMFPTRPDWSHFSLKEAMHRYEAHFIQLALKETGGKVTPAAGLLGLSGHQSLQFLLNRRHKNLLSARTPVVPRRRSFTTQHDRDGVSHSAKRTRTARILHVEDNQAVSGMIRELLEGEGWQVETCGDGAEAQEQLISDAPYDLLLLDYDLPSVNGIELVQQARELAHRRAVPIVVLSGTAVEEAVMHAGADAFLRKPEDIASVVETIARLLSSAEH